MKEETDWKPTFVHEFETLLFELKLLRPAFVLLFALLPTISAYFINMSTSARESTFNNERQFPHALFVGCIPWVCISKTALASYTCFLAVRIYNISKKLIN